MEYIYVEKSFLGGFYGYCNDLRLTGLGLILYKAFISEEFNNIYYLTFQNKNDWSTVLNQ